MAFMMNYILCIVLLSWISVSAKPLRFSGDWRGEMKKCYNEGDETQEYLFNMGTLELIASIYGNLTKNTAVTAKGEMTFNTTTTGFNLERILQLTTYKTGDDFKSYEGIVGAGGSKPDVGMQMGSVRLIFTLYKNGEINLKKDVHAESWNATDCCQVNSTIDELTIDT